MGAGYDIVAVGGGHNGLVAAAYLAKAGKKVIVLERNPHPGGGVVTAELTAPGFRQDRHSSAHIFILSNPLMKNDELGLKSKFGLEYIIPEIPFGTMFDDGSVLLTHRSIEKTAESVAQFSKKDAEAYVRFANYAVKMQPMLLSSMFTPPLPVGALVATMDQSPEGRDLFRTMLRSGFDIVNEWFESDKIKIHLLKFVSENLQGPEENGTGIGLVAMLGLAHTTGVGLPKGGSGKLTEALVKCIESYGGTVLTGADVTKFHIGSGRVTAVETTTGERYDARDAVIGAIHPHLLRDYFPAMNADVAARAERTQTSQFTLMNTHYALNQRAHFRGDGEILHDAYMIELVPTDMDKFRRSFDDLRYRRLADPITTFSLGIQSDHDPGRVPAGKSNLYFMAFATYDLADRQNWDDIKWKFADQMIRDVGVWVDNLTPDNIIARHVDSPLDLERSSKSFRRGDIHGLGPYFYQMNGHRPTPDLAQYKIPGIDRFYLVGPFMHPGGGVFGAGRGAAIAISRDLKIDFDKVARSS